MARVYKAILHSRGDAMATALEAIARQGGISAIPDPCIWQHEVREDRPMPERERQC